MATITTNLYGNQTTEFYSAPIPYSGTLGTTALNSAYVYGSTGNCIGITFIPTTTGNITDLWVYVSSYSGTWGNTDGVINCEIRDGQNGSYKAGTSIITGGSFTITLDGSTTGWVKKSGLSIAVTAGTLYTILLADTDGGATNYVTLSRSQIQYNINFDACLSPFFTSTNGFSTGSSPGSSIFATIAVKCAGLMYCSGAPSTSAALTSNTVRRGVRFKLNNPGELIGLRTASNAIAIAETVELYADGVNPGGGALFTYSKPAWTTGGAFLGSFVYHFSSTYQLAADTWYRLTLLPASNSTLPYDIIPSGSPDTDVLSAILPYGGNCYKTIESGGAWSDTTSRIIQMSPMIGHSTRPTIVS